MFSATSPFSQKGGGQISKDEETAFISVLLDIGIEDLTEPIAQSFVKAAEPGRKAGMEVAAGGSIGSELSEPATESSEVVGLVAAMIILAFTFGTLVAMGLPLLTAVFGLGGRAVADRAARTRHRGADDRADARDDDRPRSGHRLRPLHGQPLSLRARRGPGDP